jgi:hypothetical protein
VCGPWRPKLPPPLIRQLAHEPLARLEWRDNKLFEIRADGSEELAGRFYDSTASRIIQFLIERPGRAVTREEYDRSVPFEFRLGNARYFRSFLSRSLALDIFHSCFHVRGDWAMYQPIAENFLIPENFS